MEKNLLYFLFGNIDMAKVTTQQLIELSEDQSFKKSLLDDLSEYERFYNRALQLKDGDEQLKNISPLAKFSTKASMMLETFKDKSPSKMSGMLIKGFEMGIQDITQNLETGEEKREDVIALAKEYRQMLIDNMEKYKSFR